MFSPTTYFSIFLFMEAHLHNIRKYFVNHNNDLKRHNFETNIQKDDILSDNYEMKSEIMIKVHNLLLIPCMISTYEIISMTIHLLFM